MDEDHFRLLWIKKKKKQSESKECVQKSVQTVGSIHLKVKRPVITVPADLSLTNESPVALGD